MTALRHRVPALLAIAVPVGAGMAWMAAAGAPGHYSLVNAGALALAAVWIMVGREPRSPMLQTAMAGTLLALMALPLVTGPFLPSLSQEAVARWIPLGPVTLHAGMAAIPPLAVFAARDERFGWAWLGMAIVIALFQPDAASGFALTFAAVGVHHVTKDWRVGLVAVIGFFASLLMGVAGELPPQEFVEQVVQQSTASGLAVTLALVASLGASFLLVVFAAPLERAARMGLAGCLFGFVMTAVMSSYPTPLVGYGAAPILGFGLALGLVRKERI